MMHILADTVVMTGNIFGYHFVLTLSQLIYWAIAAIVGIVQSLSLVGAFPLVL